MKKITSILFYLFIVSFLSAQTKPEKIKIILMGSFHYGSTGDANSTKFIDLFSKKRQDELEFITQKLQNFGVSKIFLETDVNEQQWQDDQFEKYKKETLKDSISLKDERVQIGFRLAKKTNAVLIAADSKIPLNYEKMNLYEKKHKDDKPNPDSFFEIPYPFTQKLKKLKESSLSEYYIQLNSEYSRQANQYDYLHYAMSYGDKNDYTGQLFTLSFYDRNLKIYNNVLRNLNPKTDKIVLVLFGAAHTNIIRQFFQNHPYFEIIELEEILK